MNCTTNNTLKNVFTAAFAATFLLITTSWTAPSFGQSKDVRNDDRGPTFSTAKGESRAAEAQPQVSLRRPASGTARTSKQRYQSRVPLSSNTGATFSTAKNSSRAAQKQPQTSYNVATYSQSRSGKGKLQNRVPQTSHGAATFGNARATGKQPQTQLGGAKFSVSNAKSRRSQRQPKSQLGRPTFRQTKGGARAAQRQPQSQYGGTKFSVAAKGSRAAQRQPQSQLGGPTYRVSKGKARAAQNKQQKPNYREDNNSRLTPQPTQDKPMWSMDGLIKGFCGTNDSKTNGKSNRYDRTAEPVFSGTAEKLRVSGTAQLEAPVNALNGDAVAYTFTSADPEFEFQTGSSQPTTEPVIDESTPGMVVWTFDATQGPNAYFDNEELHVIHSKNGLIFCTWTANCRIEVDLAADGEVTQTWNGQFQIVGGTGAYRFATGTWDFSMVTEPNAGELSENALFEFAGSVDVPVRFDNGSGNNADGKAYREN